MTTRRGLFGLVRSATSAPACSHPGLTAPGRILLPDLACEACGARGGARGEVAPLRPTTTRRWFLGSLFAVPVIASVDPAALFTRAPLLTPVGAGQIVSATFESDLLRIYTREHLYEPCELEARRFWDDIPTEKGRPRRFRVQGRRRGARA
jgi:hypothetical protein